MKLQGLGGFSTAVRLCRTAGAWVNDESIFPPKNRRTLATRTLLGASVSGRVFVLQGHYIRRARIMAKAHNDDTISGQISRRCH